MKSDPVMLLLLYDVRSNKIQSDLYYAATLGTLKTGRLIEVGRFIEVSNTAV